MVSHWVVSAWRSFNPPNETRRASILHRLGSVLTHARGPRDGIARLEEALPLNRELGDSASLVIMTLTPLTLAALDFMGIVLTVLLENVSDFIPPELKPVATFSVYVIILANVIAAAAYHAVSPETQTSWKEELLWRLYVDTYNHLTQRYGDEVIERNQAGLNELLKARPDDLSVAEITRFLEGLPQRYLQLFARDVIYRHVRESTPDLVLELGTAHGASAAYIAAALEENRKGRLVTVDRVGSGYDPRPLLEQRTAGVEKI